MVRWAAAVIVALFVITIAEDNVRTLAEEKHWNQYLGVALRAVPDLSKLTGSWWFIFGFGLAIGIAIGLWVPRAPTQQRNDLEAKRLLIRKARQLAVQQLPQTDFRKVLEGSSLYHRLRPYLSEEFKESVRNANVIIVPSPGSALPGLAISFLREIEILEKRWGLLLK